MFVNIYIESSGYRHFQHEQTTHGNMDYLQKNNILSIPPLTLYKCFVNIVTETNTLESLGIHPAIKAILVVIR